MEIKCLEVRDDGTFMPMIFVRPVPTNEAQRYLLRRDGYRGEMSEPCVIAIKPQCQGVSYDPYDWHDQARTVKVAHDYVAKNWATLRDGDVVDVEFILGESPAPKLSERET
jgi:hypothetical protein